MGTGKDHIQNDLLRSTLDDEGFSRTILKNGGPLHKQMCTGTRLLQQNTALIISIRTKATENYLVSVYLFPPELAETIGRGTLAMIGARIQLWPGTSYTKLTNGRADQKDVNALKAFFSRPSSRTSAYDERTLHTEICSFWIQPIVDNF